jgi:hypothetical protein
MAELQLVTYYRINFFDLMQLCREHLGIVLRGDKIAEEGTVMAKWAFDKFDFDPAEDMYPFGQDTYTIIDGSEFAEDSLEWYVENYGENSLDTYMKQLFDKGLLPTDHPLFVDICW